MLACNKCNTPLDDDAKFCENCGEKVPPPAPEPAPEPEVLAPPSAMPPEPQPETVFCHECGHPVEAGMAFCQNCGTKIQVQEPVDTSDEIPTPPKKRLPIKAIAAAAAVILLVVAGVLVVPRFLGGSGSADNAFLYIKDNEMIYTDLKKKKPLEVTSRLYDETFDYGMGSSITQFVYLAGNGRDLFYPDKITDGSDGITLYTRNLASPKEEPVKIDSDLIRYFVNTAANKVIYIKGSDGILYENNLKEKTKIDSGVLHFYANPDGSKVVYVKDEDIIYSKEANKDKEKIDSDSQLVKVSDDLSKIYYIKEGTLYYKHAGKDKEKIAADVSYVSHIYDSGEIYYVKADDIETRLSEFVDDDLLAQDRDFDEPERPQPPSYRDFDGLDDYNAANALYEIEAEEYRNLMTEYDKKKTRDQLRFTLEQEMIETQQRTLYYYDGSSSTAVTDALDSVLGIGEAKPVIVYLNYNKSEAPSLKMSEINSISDVQMAAQASSAYSSEMYVAVGSVSNGVDATSPQNPSLNQGADKLYFLDDFDSERRYGDLIEITISSTGSLTSNVYDTEVSYFKLLGKEDQVVYCKNVKEYDGDLYINKIFVDSDVNQYSASSIKDSNTITYYMDWNEERRYGTLKTYGGGKSEKIADDVSNYYAISENRIAYLADYSVKTYRGDGYLYLGKNKKEKIDDDIQGFVPISQSTSNYRGRSYYGG